MIPKIIHYCWFGNEPISGLELDCIESWKRTLPDFQIKRWDESNFDYEAFGFSREAYKLKRYAFVSDVCRLFALYQDGGIYLDTDMLVLKDFSTLLHEPFFIGEEREGIVNAGVIGSESGNQVVKCLLEGYQKLAFDFYKPLSIPIYLSSVLDRSKIKIYPCEVFYAVPFQNRGDNFQNFVTSGSLAVHLWSYSWRNEWSYLHEKKFSKSWAQFLRSVRIGGFNQKSVKFVVAYFKFLIADKFPGVYKRLKK